MNRNLQPEQFTEWDPFKHLTTAGTVDYLRAKKGKSDFQMPEYPPTPREEGELGATVVTGWDHEPTRVDRVKTSKTLGALDAVHRLTRSTWLDN